MKGIQFQCLYDVDDNRYKYTAFNQDGSLVGFVNPPVRNFNLGAWVDSTNGDPGEHIIFERWDVSMREPSEMSDLRKPKFIAKVNERKRKK